jgi:predicted  nucleic acid-binding Zn-ribbon protein|tara:strand:- start:431 stop:724 length:294 start_codon:yes stop_codon:yes gene_type:complete
MTVRPNSADDPLLAAVTRLNGALARIEGQTKKLRGRVERAESAAVGARDSDDDRARLADALDTARAREAELQQAAQEASEALDRAIGELRLHVDEGA